jgi:hypothetical protein
MPKQLLGNVVAFAAMIISAAGLSAQSPTPPPSKLTGSCSSGLSGGGSNCPLDHRVLIDVRRQGAGAPPELEQVVHIGASGAEVFSLTPDQATTADSTLFAVIRVNRDASGQYRIEESISGSLVTHPNNCRGCSTGTLDDLAFGAYLATVTTRLVRCAQHAHSRSGKQ